MVAVYSPKTRIDYILNSPHASLEFATALRHHPDHTGVEQLLTAASIIRDNANSVATSTPSDVSSSTNSKLSPITPAMASKEVIQPLKSIKRRKRQNVKCPVCSRTFGDTSSARKHHRVVHLKIKEFACQECGKTFAEKSNRSKHYIAAHLNQRSHACPDCDKVFNFTDGLRRHRNNVHLGLRPYPCELCNTSYKQKTHLLKHKQSVHGMPIPPKKNSN